MKIISDERCTGYSQAGHPENPRRVAATAALLRSQTELPATWVAPAEGVPDEILLRAHAPEMLARLDVPENFDADTPFFENISALARRSVAAATGAKRVAVFDFDVHHGNGTEDVLLNQPGLEFFSIHQHPAYPNTGAENRGRNCFNYPVAPGASRTTYRAALQHALDDLKHFRPDLVAVSAGFDAYAHDPLAEGTLLAEDFHWLGKSLRELQIPFFSLLEGGYSRDLPELIFAYLKGVAGK
ncbi:MAG TPA: histone deacetylase [Verrucomicrobiae bacterium]